MNGMSLSSRWLKIDMPYGLKSRCKPKTDDVELNVNNDEPPLVGAS